MATIDTSIYRIPQVRGVGDFLADADAAEARGLGLQSNRLGLLLQQRQMKQADRADRDAESLRAALQSLGPKATDDDLLGLLRGRGMFQEAGKLQTDILTRKAKEEEARKSKAQADKELFAKAKSETEQALNILGGARDQGSYMQAMQALQAMGVDPSKYGAPATYDPAFIENAKGLVMTQAQRLEQEWKRRGHDLDVHKQAVEEANKIMLPGGAVNQPLVAAKAGIARAGASQVNVNATQEKEESKAVGKFLGEQYADIQKAGIGAQGKLDRAARMEQLLSKISTGKLEGFKKDAASVAQAFGITLDPNLPEKEAFEALSNQLALEARNPSGGAGMPGAMSDKDREFLQAITPNLSKTPEGNRTILETTRKLAKRDAEVARKAREYRQKNGALDEGFFEELRQFSDANPLFDVQGARRDSKGRPPLSSFAR